MYKLDLWLGIAHLKGERHLLNEPDQYRKVCEKCNIEIVASQWSHHLRTKIHLQNDPNHIVLPVRPKKLNTPTRLHKKT